jgi:hypothetical protein
MAQGGGGGGPGEQQQQTQKNWVQLHAVSSQSHAPTVLHLLPCTCIAPNPLPPTYSASPYPATTTRNHTPPTIVPTHLLPVSAGVCWPQVLEGAVAAGRARSIGVSNYTAPHLQELLGRCSIRPAVNQVEVGGTKPHLSHLPLCLSWFSPMLGIVLSGGNPWVVQLRHPVWRRLEAVGL